MKPVAIRMYVGTRKARVTCVALRGFGDDCRPLPIRQPSL